MGSFSDDGLMDLILEYAKAKGISVADACRLYSTVSGIKKDDAIVSACGGRSALCIGIYNDEGRPFDLSVDGDVSANVTIDGDISADVTILEGKNA